MSLQHPVIPKSQQSSSSYYAPNVQPIPGGAVTVRYRHLHHHQHHHPKPNTVSPKPHSGSPSFGFNALKSTPFPNEMNSKHFSVPQIPSPNPVNPVVPPQTSKSMPKPVPKKRKPFKPHFEFSVSVPPLSIPSQMPKMRDSSQIVVEAGKFEFTFGIAWKNFFFFFNFPTAPFVNKNSNNGGMPSHVVSSKYIFELYFIPI